MSDIPPQPSGRSLKSWLVVAVAATACALAYGFFALKPAAALPMPQLRPEPPEATAAEVQRLCAACHAYPHPDTFPRAAWRQEVKQGYDFFHKDLSYRFGYPPLEAVVRYYENRAPEDLKQLARKLAPHAPHARFERHDHRLPGAAAPPGVTYVNLVRLFRKDKLDILVCDAIRKEVLVLSPYESPPAWKVLARGLCCAHAEVVDLDGDGINDIVLACLGNFYATDDRVGSVVWLRGAADGSFTPFTLLDFEEAGSEGKKQVAFTGNSKVEDVDDATYAQFWAGKGQTGPAAGPTTGVGSRPSGGIPKGAQTGPPKK